MRHFIVFLLLLISFDAMAVDKVLVRGKVVDQEQEPVAGASVTVLNHSLGVNTNAKGEYLLTLPAGKVSITVSFTGYKTKTVEYDLQVNTNNVDFTLEKDPVALESVTITAQQREQQLLDIPVTISAVSAQTLETNNIRNLEQLSDFVPGLNIRIQTPHRPTFVIRGLSSDEVSPTAQPRVSVYFNNIPTSRASMALTELYDIERVEVAKGPLGTLFGRGAQIGAINFISKKPADDFGGYLSAGLGNFAMKEVQGAVNIPIVKNKLTARASGIYSYQDGYVKNLSGGDNLNGKNTFGGRLALAYQPVEKLRFDLMLSYQKDNNPGTAFMSKKYLNSNEEDIFSYNASLDPGKTWYNKRDVLLTSLDVKYYFNANNYLSYTASFTNNTADHHWDGDGTVAPAIDMTEGVKANQLSQEIRYNYSVNSRLNGFVGGSYWREDVKYKHSFSPNEQYFGHLYLPILAEGIDNAYGMGGTLLGGVKQELDYYNLFTPLTSLPVALQMLLEQSGMPQIPPLTTNHSEESNNGAVNQSFDIFADATYKITSKLNITAGIRGTYEAIETTTEAHFTGGDATTMGLLSGTYPNVFYKERADTAISKNFLSLVYRLNLQYLVSDKTAAFVGYSRGRRPNVLQFGTMGYPEEMKAEQLHSFDAGLKWALQQRFWFNAGVFYQRYNDFQTTKWTEGNYLTADAGRATSYGIEADANYSICKYLDVFGNYGYIHARFDDEDSDGNRQEYAGKTFRLTPEHSFLLGLNAKANITNNLQVILTPTYSWKSHIWFEDSNDLQPADPTLDRLEQDAYGLLNANLAFRLGKPGITLSVFGSNLLDKQFIISAGNTGMMFGVPTYVLGMPRMFGAKLTWKFGRE